MKIIFIGSRSEVLKKILELQLDFQYSFVVENSYSEKILKEKNLKYEVISNKNKSDIFNKISAMSFDLLVSNGVPIIRLVSKIKKLNQIFINIHPSFLPYYKGISPNNRCISK